MGSSKLPIVTLIWVHFPVNKTILQFCQELSGTGKPDDYQKTFIDDNIPSRGVKSLSDHK